MIRALLLAAALLGAVPTLEAAVVRAHVKAVPARYGAAAGWQAKDKTAFIRELNLQLGSVQSLSTPDLIGRLAAVHGDLELPAPKQAAREVAMEALASPTGKLPKIAAMLRESGETAAWRKAAENLEDLGETLKQKDADEARVLRSAFNRMRKALRPDGSLRESFAEIEGLFAAMFDGAEEEAPAAAAKLGFEEVGKAPFLGPDYYVRSLLKKARAPQASKFVDEIGWRAKSENELATLAARFPAPKRARGKLGVELSVVEDPREKRPHMLLLGIFRAADGAPVGTFASKIFHDKDGELVAEIEHVRFDKNSLTVSGIGRAVILFLDAEVYAPLGIRRELIKADYIGRHVWAKLGYKFLEKYWLKDVGGGPPIKYWELARKNFARYLKRRKLNLKDLVVYQGGKARPLSSLDELVDPIDFASVRHKKGDTISVRPLIGQDAKDRYVLGDAVDLHVGQGFMVGDYTTDGKGDYIVSMARTKFAADAMPYWNGYREVGVPDAAP